MWMISPCFKEHQVAKQYRGQVNFLKYGFAHECPMKYVNELKSIAPWRREHLNKRNENTFGELIDGKINKPSVFW